MKWQNHAGVACFASLACGFSLPAAVVTAATSNLPDQIETPFGPSGPRLIPHRKMSHNLFLWLGLYCVALLCGALHPTADLSRYFTVPDFLLRFAERLLAFLPQRTLHAFFCGHFGPESLLFGPLLHVLSDSLTKSGIPAGKRQISFRLFKTGSALEYLFCFSFYTLVSLLLATTGPLVEIGPVIPVFVSFAVLWLGQKSDGRKK